MPKRKQNLRKKTYKRTNRKKPYRKKPYRKKRTRKYKKMRGGSPAYLEALNPRVVTAVGSGHDWEEVIDPSAGAHNILFKCINYRCDATAGPAGSGSLQTCPWTKPRPSPASAPAPGQKHLGDNLVKGFEAIEEYAASLKDGITVVIGDQLRHSKEPVLCNKCNNTYYNRAAYERAPCKPRN